jgi:hypothetical protein
MSTWEELLAAGYTRIIGAWVEGIPVDLLETRIFTTEDSSTSASTDAQTIIPCLRISDGEAISAELDRATGLARGRSIELGVDLATLATVPAAARLFATPTRRALLSATVSNPAATTFNVVSTTGWPSTGGFFVGREYCTYSGTTATSFTGVTRAVKSLAHYHDASTVSGYRYLADVPLYWRGRFVVLYEHLVAPDMRYLGAQVNTVGAYCRELWKGYVDGQPSPTGKMMRVRALPLDRLLAQTIASNRSGTATFSAPTRVAGSGQTLNGNAIHAVYVTEADKLFVQDLHNPPGEGQFPRFLQTGVTTLTRWAQRVTEDVGTYLPDIIVRMSDIVYEDDTDSPSRVRFIFRSSGGGATHFQVAAAPLAWFLGTVSESIVRNPIGTNAANQFDIEFAPNKSPVSWLIIAIDYDAAGEPLPWPTSGYLRLESDDNDAVEIVRYDAIDDTIDPAGLLIAVRVVERELMGTPRVDPWKHNCAVALLAGFSGSLDEVIRTIATSSGTGARGSYDTLGFGLGLGIPDAWLDVSQYPLNGIPCDAMADDESSLEDMIGGWLALLGRCLVQRQQSDGIVRIVAASTTIEVAGEATTITAADVALGMTQVETLYDTPNVVTIEDSLRNKKTIAVLRDVPRQQAEGPREMTFVAPSISPGEVVIYGTKMLQQSDGQMVVTLQVRDGLGVRVGDAVRLDIGHPLVWDWETNSAAGVVPARVIGEEESLGTGARRLTFLVPGQLQGGRVLCPAAVATARPSPDEMTIDDTTGFAVGHLVLAYRRGDEASFTASREIKTITGDVIEFTASLSTTDYPADGETWLTYDDFAAVIPPQDEHLFVVTGQEFT